MLGTVCILLLAASATQAQGDNLKIGARVLVTSVHSGQHQATVVAVQAGQVQVHYEDVDAPNAWVKLADVALFNAGNTAGGPPTGTYQCWYPKYENTYMGRFVIPSKGRYQYLTGTKTSGTYTYTAATRTLQWKGGAMAELAKRSEYTNIAGQAPTIEVHFGKGKRHGDYQRCLLLK
jgi:hypothetical protein